MLLLDQVFTTLSKVETQYFNFQIKNKSISNSYNYTFILSEKFKNNFSIITLIIGFHVEICLTNIVYFLSENIFFIYANLGEKN